MYRAMPTTSGALCRKPSRIVVLIAFLALAFSVAPPENSFATHAPNGAICMDCHSVSAIKMVPGSHLIKKSARSVQLGYTSGGSAPCLFCHDWNATGATAVDGNLVVNGPDRMKGVRSHFSSLSRSKHRVDLGSDLNGSPTTFDCIDCHEKITATVVSGSNQTTPNVHPDLLYPDGYDASDANYSLSVESTLIGAPLSLSNKDLSEATCLNNSCHGGLQNNSFAAGRISKQAHSTSNGITINDTPLPAPPNDKVYCTQCHGKHNSFKGDKLIVLQTDGTTSNLPSDGDNFGCDPDDLACDPTETVGSVRTGSLVTPDKCGECHDFDDGGAASAWMTKGHGGNTYAGDSIGLICESCHLSSKPHDFSGADKRFGLPEDVSVSAVTGKSLHSVCTVCHQTFTAHQGQAGCLDCHDPHGAGVGTNIIMVRQEIPVPSPTDTVNFNISGVYDLGSTEYDYYGVTTLGAYDAKYDPPQPLPAPQSSNSSQGICDNQDCHGGKTNFNANEFWSLNYYFNDPAVKNDHKGFFQAPGANCQGCHKHNDPTGSWSPSAACNVCHGYPPNKSDSLVDNADAVGIHETHATQLSYSCTLCHYGNNHNESGWGSNRGEPIPNPETNVDVVFDPAVNPSGSYDPATNICSNLTCHNPDDAAIGITGKGDSSQTERSAPVWLDDYKTTASAELTRNGNAANGGNWEIGDAGEECEACHLNSVFLSGGGTAQPDGGAHFAHENPTAPQKNYLCSTCHSGENSATNLYSADHAKGSLTDPALVNFDLSKVGMTGLGTEAFDNATSECSNVYCHGVTLANGGTDTTPIWTDTNTGNCGACHGVQGDMPTFPLKEVSSNNHPTHYKAANGPEISAGHGGIGCNSCHNSVDAMAECSMCHPSGWIDPPGVIVTLGAKAPGATTPSPTHVDGAVDFIGNVDFATTTACNNCHSTALVDGNVGVALAKANWTNTTFKIPCLNCHNQTDPANSIFDGSGVDAPAKDPFFAATGHGLDAASTYSPSGRTGAGAACLDCHDETATHFTGALDDADRLDAVGNALCNGCHDGTDDGPGFKSMARVSTHSNTSSTMTYSKLESTFELNCFECHDVHGSSNIYMVNEVNSGGGLGLPRKLDGVDNILDFAFFRNLTPGSVSFAGKSAGSNYATAGSGDANKICQTCHTQTGFYQNNSDSGHYTSACTLCHQHDFDADYAATSQDGFMPIGCDGCHGFPPTPATESYPGAGGAHLAHAKGVGKLESDPDVYGFGCLGGTCHPGDQHNQGGGVVSRANVQVAFDPTWNPNGVFTPGATPDLNTCTQMYCHSNGLVENGEYVGDEGVGEGGVTTLGEYAENSGNQAFYGTTPASPAVWGGSLTCQGCHGKGAPTFKRDSNAEQIVSPPDYYNAGVQTMANGDVIYNTTGANTHFIHVYKMPNNSSGDSCRCHSTNASATAPTHVNRRVDVTGCSGCHIGSGSFTFGEKYGSDSVDNCVFWCHGKLWLYDSPGGRITKQTGSTQPQDNQPKYKESGHGLAVTSTYASGNPGAGLKCSDCHLLDDRYTTKTTESYHYERSPAATGYSGPGSLGTNPYWLKNPYAADPDGLCKSCHDGVTAVDADNHHAQGMIDAGYSPKYDALVPGTWDTFTPKCIDCHDPHGEPNMFMLYDNDAEKSISAFSATYAGPVVYEGARYGITRAESDVYGWPPQPYAANQAPVTMTTNASGSDYAAGAGTGVCEICHTQTAYYNNSGTGAEHHTNPCTDCHTHPDSFAAKCTNCHGGGLAAEGNQNLWPDSEVAGHGAARPNRGGAHGEHVKRIAQVQNGLALAQEPTTSQKNATCNWCHPTGAHTGDATDHANAPATLMDGTTYVFKDILGDSNQRLSSVVQGAGADTVFGTLDDEVVCSNVDCHYTKSQWPTDWYNPADNSGCGYCHEVSSAYTQGWLPDAHDKHMGNPDIGGADLWCYDCHVWPGSSSGAHPHQDGVVNLKIPTVPLPDSDGDASIVPGSTTKPKFGNGALAAEYTTCSNLYCHGDFDPAPHSGGNSANSVNWFNTDARIGAGLGDARCGTCHGSTLGTDNLDKSYPRTGVLAESHQEHIASNAKPGCSACHDSDLAGAQVGFGSYGDGSTHANGTLDLIFGDALNETETVDYEGAGTFPAYVGASKTCTDIRCHNGVETPAFDLIDSGVGDNIVCGNCHNTGNAGPLPSASAVAGSHSAHANNDAVYVECDNCHGDAAYNVSGSRGGSAYTATGGGGGASNGLHQNLTVNLFVNAGSSTYDDIANGLNAGVGGVNYQDLSGSGGEAVPTDNGTCNITMCHGVSSPVWGAAGSVNCLLCHGRTTALGGDLDNYSWTNFSGAAAMINTDEWTSTGHGAAAAYASGNLGAAFSGPAFDPNGCSYCHGFLGTVNNPTVIHGDASNPFRLANKGVLNGSGNEHNGWNDVCLVCHTVGDSGYDPDGAGSLVLLNGSRDIDENHYGGKHGAGTAGGTFCWDCHDPHGDVQNYMIHSGDGSAPGRGVTQTSDGLYGVPIVSREVTGLDAVSGGYTSDDLVNAALTGLCQTCHASSGGANYFNQATYTLPSNHNGADTLRCTLCHLHGNDFSPSCNDCHGISADGSGRPPYAPTNNLTGSPTLVWNPAVDPIVGDGTGIGNHRAVSTTTPPITASSHESFGCSECHTDSPGSGVNHNDGAVNADMDNIAVKQTWTGFSGPLAAVWDKGILDGANDGLGGPGDVTDDNCNNIDCHSPYYNGNAGVSGTPLPYKRWWMNSNEWDCYSCHGYNGMVGPASGANMYDQRLVTGTHANHLISDPFSMSAAGNTYDCAVCHVDNSGNLSHKDGTVNFSFNVAFDPYATTSTYSQAGQIPTDNDTGSGHRAFGACSNVYCHSSAQSDPPGSPPAYANPTWGVITSACGGCHGPGRHEINGMTTGSHTAHTRFDCRLCHSGGGCLDCHGRNNRHVNGEINVWLNQGSARDGITVQGGIYDTDNNLLTDEDKGIPGQPYGRCTNVSCHSDAKNKKSFVTPVTDERPPVYATITWKTPSPGCEGCHGGTSVNALGTYQYGAPDYANEGETTQAANSHSAHVNSGISCSTCHNTTLTDTDPSDGWTLITGTFVNQVPHMNDVINVVLAAAFDTNGATANYVAATKTCSGVSCHGADAPQWGQAAMPQVICNACHDGSLSSAPKVVWPAGNSGRGAGNEYGSHLRGAKSDTLTGGTNWNTQCNKCHTGHSGSVLVDLPPDSSTHFGLPAATNMQTRLGIDYASGIHLGGTATSGASEAELCWNCHGAGPANDDVNEWGYNADTNGPNYPHISIALETPMGSAEPVGRSYNYGWLYSDSNWTSATADWTIGYRRDAYQHSTATTPAYALSRRISSIHSVNFDLNAAQASSVANNVNASGILINNPPAVLENKSQIRCSYCHDVHDVNKAVDPILGGNETMTGRPHLRGSWMGNPYPPDMPPLDGYSYPSAGGPIQAGVGIGNRIYNQEPGYTGPGFTGPTPRFFASAYPANVSKGGFHIDANSNRPTTDASYNSLEETAGLCVLCHGDQIDAMDYYTGSKLWRADQVNGHSNSTLGGTGSNKRNIFDPFRGSTYRAMGHQDGVDPAFPITGNWGFGAPYYAWGSAPFYGMGHMFKSGNGRSPIINSGWYGGNPGDVSKGSDYANWYTNGSIGSDPALGAPHKFTCSKCHSPHATGLPALLITNCLDQQLSTFSIPGDGGSENANPAGRQASNCHRNESTSTGWHKLAPAQ